MNKKRAYRVEKMVYDERGEIKVVGERKSEGVFGVYEECSK